MHKKDIVGDTNSVNESYTASSDAAWKREVRVRVMKEAPGFVEITNADRGDTPAAVDPALLREIANDAVRLVEEYTRRPIEIPKGNYSAKTVEYRPAAGAIHIQPHDSGGPVVIGVDQLPALRRALEGIQNRIDLS